MNFEIEGTLHKKFEVESKSSSFQTRDFVLLSEGTYPQHIKFQLTQDRCAAIDPFEDGERIKVSFDLRGREWQGKYFTNLNAWRIEKASANIPQETINQANTPPSFPVDNQNNDFLGGLPSDFDQLPF